MIRPMTLIWLTIAAALGFALFQVKHEVGILEEELARLNRTILDEQETIHVLSAEWSYLTRPERLQALNDRYLGLTPMTVGQLAAIEDLPMRAGPDAASGDEAAAGPAAPFLPVSQALPTGPGDRQ